MILSDIVVMIMIGASLEIALARTSTMVGNSSTPQTILSVLTAYDNQIQALFDPNAATDEADDQVATAVSGADTTSLSAIHELLVAGEDPNLRDPNGRTALMMASAGGYDRIVKELIAFRADPNLPDNSGMTALMVACALDHPRIVQLLVTAGANVNAKSDNGSSPLLLAAANGDPEIGALLLHKGAVRNDKFNGKNANDIAKMAGNKSFQAMLAQRSVPEEFHEDFALTEMGRSPNNVRGELLSSLIFKDSFLLTTSGENTQSLALQGSQKERLLQELQFLLSAVKAMFTKQEADLVAEFGKLNDPSSAAIELSDSGQAAGWTQLSGDTAKPFLIVVDAKLLQANLKASITAGFPALTTASQAERIDFLDAERRQIEDSAYLTGMHVKANGVGALRAPLSEVSAMPEYIMLLNLSQKIRPVETQYYGSLLFALAHEVGHVALGHLSGVYVSCHDRELAADKFATKLLGESLLALSASPINVTSGNAKGTMVFIDQDSLTRYTGFSLFFGGAYELAHFPPSTGTCIYPSPTERLAETKKGLSEVTASKQTAVISMLEHRYNSSLASQSYFIAHLAGVQALH